AETLRAIARVGRVIVVIHVARGAEREPVVDDAVAVVVLAVADLGLLARAVASQRAVHAVLLAERADADVDAAGSAAARIPVVDDAVAVLVLTVADFRARELAADAGPASSTVTTEA